MTLKKQSDPVAFYIKMHKKNMLVAFLLAFFFGPIGLVYASWKSAIVLIMITIATIPILAKVGLIAWLIVWLIAIVISIGSVHYHNEQVRATAGLMQR